jgi:hypothetical protein
MLVSAVEDLQTPLTPMAERIAAFGRGSERRRPVMITDPFLRRFFERVPSDIARSFTPAQLDAIKMVFGAST